MQIKYQLVAQVEGAEDMYVLRNPKRAISKFRYERPIIITQREMRQPMINIQKTLKVAVGGFVGLAKTESITTITLAKD